MTNECTCVYDGNAYEDVKMLWLQYDKHNRGNVNGDEHLINHSCPDFVLAAVTEEMHRSDDCAYHHECERYYLINAHAGYVGYPTEFRDGCEM